MNFRMIKTLIESFKREADRRTEENSNAAFRCNYGTVNKYGRNDIKKNALMKRRKDITLTLNY